MEAAIRTEGLSKRFGNVEALASLDLDAHEGEELGYLGETTTIRLLLGLLRPMSGKAAISGSDVGRDAAGLPAPTAKPACGPR